MTKTLKTNNSNKKKRNSRGTGSIRKKNGGYEGRITIKVNGKSKQISLFNKDRRILLQEMIRVQHEADINAYIGKDKITLDKWLKKWIKVYKKPFVKPRTIQGYIEKITNNIIPYLGDYPLQNLNRGILQEFFNDLSKGNKKKKIKKYSPKTIKEIKSILNMAFNDAVIDNIIHNNPITYIKTKKVGKGKKKALISLEQQKELVNILLSETNGFCYIFILNTGLRPGESGGIKWKHYNYEGSYIELHDNYGRVTFYDDDFNKIETKNIEKELKTPSSYRKIPLQKWLNDLMYLYMMYVMKQRGYSEFSSMANENIFINSLGNALSTDYLWSTLDTILKRHNFTHLSVYDLRHIFATRCVDVNIPINQIQQYLGHTLASTTMDYYVGYDEDSNTKEIQKLASISQINMLPSYLST